MAVVKVMAGALGGIVIFGARKKLFVLIAFGVVLLAAAIALRNSMKSTNREVQKCRNVLFTSHLGNSFVAPSIFTQTDKGDTFTLKSPDGQALIYTIMFTAEGSGTLTEFGELMASSLLPKGATKWHDSKWTAIKFAETVANKKELIPIPESHQQWRVYIVDGGKFYHAVILNASNIAMTLNGDFYEKIDCTFKGVKE